MKAETIAVGTELLIGQIANTNAKHISKKLNEHGISVYYHSVVGDNKERIKGLLDIAVERSELIVFTGGLGPTEDDLTKETICEYFDIGLYLDQDILDMIESYFVNRNIPMVKSNKKQAYLPEGCVVLYNRYGTAPGFYLDIMGVRIVVLPGPPAEMEPMFDDFLKHHLIKDKTIYSRFVNIFGIGESTVEEKILDIIHQNSAVTLATYASYGQVVIRVTTMAKDEVSAGAEMKYILEALHKRFGPFIFSDEEETTLPVILVKMLSDKNIKLAAAESCTGGMISKLITDCAGASECFLGGVIAYSNQIKTDILGVMPKTLEENGAVSEKTCLEMAAGIKRLTGADIGVAVTGIAGPGGGSDDKPVGTVYISICSGAGKVKAYSFTGSRDKIRNMAALYALDMVRREFLS